MESSSAQRLAAEAAGAAKEAARQGEKAAERAQAAAEHVEAAAPVGSPDALGVGFAGLLLVAAAILVVTGVTTGPEFAPDKDFQLFAGFYVVAQAVERLVELLRALLPGRSVIGKANVALITGALSVLLGVAASAGLGLYFLNAVAVDAVPERVDVLVSGLLIAGGTAGLHELISRIEKSKRAAAASAAAGSAAAASEAADAAAQAEQVASKAGTAARRASDAALRAITAEEEAEGPGAEREGGAGEGDAPPGA